MRLLGVVLLIVTMQGAAWSYQAEILRDGFGVPHIYGKTDADAVFGFGYAQAQDHFADLARNYYAAMGRAAELAGPDAADLDYQTRLYKIPDLAEEGLTRLTSRTGRTSPTGEFLKAFCAGVNHYAATHESALPAALKTFRYEPVMLVAMSQFLLLHEALDNLNAKLVRESQPGQSNQWVAGKSRTADGGVFFLMDPHLPWEGMQRWYEAHLVGDRLNVYGATFYGLPLIVMGHNGKAAWSMTRNDPDLADVFIEKVSPDGRKYLAAGGWKALQTSEIRFKVKRKGGHGFDVEKRRARYTIHGPVVEERPGGKTVLTAAIEGVPSFGILNEVYAMATAGGLADFKKAVSAQEIPLWNLMFGDSGGGMFYVYNARVHDRPGRADRMKPLSGWKPEDQWGATIPFSQLPMVENPPSGYMMNTNVMPWNVTPGAGLRPEDYSEALVDRQALALNPRGQRATELLSRPKKLTLNDALAIATDEKAPGGRKEIELAQEDYAKLKKAGAKFENPRDLPRAFDILEKWDGVADTDSVGTTLVAAAAKEYANAEKKPSPAHALDRALTELKNHYGTIEVKWGDAHRLRKGDHDYPLGGGTSEVPALWMADGPVENAKIVCARGSSFTMLVHFKPGGKVEAFSLLPFGESEDPKSPHYADQMPLKSRGELKHAWFDRAEVEAQAKSREEVRS